MPSKTLVLVSIHMTREMLAAIDELVRRGAYPTRSELIRSAVAKYLADMGMKIEAHTEPQTPGGKNTLVITTTVEEGGSVTVKCARCGYEMALFSDDSIADLIRMLRARRTRCPKCGSNELTLEFTKPIRKKPKAAMEATQA